jgi:hypothetical protein
MRHFCVSGSSRNPLREKNPLQPDEAQIVTTTSERIGHWTKCANLAPDSANWNHKFGPILGGLHHHYAQV